MMKRMKAYLALILAGVLILSAWGCQKFPAEIIELPITGATEATEPAPTVPPTTTPPLTEAPAELPTEPMIHGKTYLASRPIPDFYEPCKDGSHIFYYTGDSGTVAMDDFGLTVKLPEEWVGRVKICRDFSTDSMVIYLINYALSQTYEELAPEHKASDVFAWQDYILRVIAVPKGSPKEEDLHDADTEFSRVLGENDGYIFCYYTGAFLNLPSECNTFLSIRADKIRELGREAYDEIVGDLICTPEMVPAIIMIN